MDDVIQINPFASKLTLRGRCTATADEGTGVVMLELEVIPERALSGGQWEFVLGKTNTCGAGSGPW